MNSHEDLTIKVALVQLSTFPVLIDAHHMNLRMLQALARQTTMTISEEMLTVLPAEQGTALKVFANWMQEQIAESNFAIQQYEEELEDTLVWLVQNLGIKDPGIYPAMFQERVKKILGQS